MSNDIKPTDQKGQGIQTQGGKGGHLDAAFSNLSKEDQQRLTQLAIEKKIDLEVDDYVAKRKHEAASVEMRQGIDNVREMEKSTKNDYTITGEYEGASGKTTFKVSKANNTMFIVIAVVIAVIFFVMFSK